MKISLFTYTRCAASGRKRISQSIILYRFPTPLCSAFYPPHSHGTKRNTRLIILTRFARPVDVKHALPRRRFRKFFRSFFRFGWVPPGWVHSVPLRVRARAHHEYERHVASRTYRFRDTPCAPSSFVVNQLRSFVECASETEAIKDGWFFRVLSFSDI